MTHEPLDDELIASLDIAARFIQQEAVDDLAFRLSGLSGIAFRDECERLAEAILTEMERLGDFVGDVETVVVLATLKAAAIKAARMSIGTA